MKNAFRIFAIIALVALVHPAVAYATTDKLATYSDGSSTYGVKNGLVSIISSNAISPTWSNDGKSLAYINPLGNSINIYYDYDNDTVPETTLMPSGVTPKLIAWSANDNFIAISSTAGKLYTMDINEGVTGINEVPNSYNAIDPEILALHWNIRTNTIMFSRSSVGISEIKPDGSNLKVLVPKSIIPSAQKKIVAFHPWVQSTNLSVNTILFVDETGTAYEYELIYDRLGNYGNPIYSDGSTVRDVSENGLAFMTRVSESGGSISIIQGALNALTLPDSNIIQHVETRPTINETMYTPYASGSVSGNKLTGYVSTKVTAQEISSKNITITPYLIDSDGNIESGTPKTVQASQYNIPTTSFDFYPDNDDDYFLTCKIEYNGDKFYEQYCPLSASIAYTTPIPPEPTVYLYPIYRFYSPIVKHHLFTADENEAQYIVDHMASAWRSEGDAFLVKAVSGCAAGENVYRFYSETIKTHLFTMDENEKNVLIGYNQPNVWRYEGVAYCAYKTQTDSEQIPVYRFYSEQLKTHLYSIDSNEKNTLINWNRPDLWRYEGIAYYAYAS